MAEIRENSAMRLFAISVGILIALICAFFLGAYLLGGSLGNARFPSLTFAGGTAEPAAPQASPAETVSERAAAPQPAPKKPVFPHMELQAQYAGPFADTLIQRWRDPIDGRVCYIYLPAYVKHAPLDKPGGFFDYGANSIGSISCGAPGPELKPAR
ncbi:hypothetical protein [Parvibaculum sp.]|jgi:hypothetical protein|uniref:hypothetical protein n=2 Tax=Parvibaculum sp. TaxID=2024848 RepID=UPI001AFEB181|nr:hypothetical protein [Parvibaculum sp.]MBO6679213.1 hypothetical protein [Parvibaculum sp.]